MEQDKRANGEGNQCDRWRSISRGFIKKNKYFFVNRDALKINEQWRRLSGGGRCSVSTTGVPWNRTIACRTRPISRRRADRRSIRRISCAHERFPFSAVPPIFFFICLANHQRPRRPTRSPRLFPPFFFYFPIESTKVDLPVKMPVRVGLVFLHIFFCLVWSFCWNVENETSISFWVTGLDPSFVFVFFLLPFSLVVGVSDKFLLRHSETRTTKAISCYWCFLHRILNRCRAGSRSLNLGWPHSVGELTFTVPNFCIRWSICLGPLKFWTLTWPFLRLYVLSNIFLKNRFKPYLGSVFYSRSIVILRFGICEFFSNIDSQWVSHGIPKSFLYWNFFLTDVWPPSILILLCWFVYQLTVALGSESAWFLCDTRRVERELFVGGAVCFCPSFQRDWSPGSCENGRGYSECSLWSGSPAARTSSLSLSLFFSLPPAPPPPPPPRLLTGWPIPKLDGHRLGKSSTYPRPPRLRFTWTK